MKKLSYHPLTAIICTVLSIAGVFLVSNFPTRKLPFQEGRKEEEEVVEEEEEEEEEEAEEERPAEEGRSWDCP